MSFCILLYNFHFSHKCNRLAQEQQRTDLAQAQCYLMGARYAGDKAESIFNILTLILNKNSFSFNNEHFLQIHGTAMGSPMAPTYANIFMAMLEQKLLKQAPQGLIPIEWIRFIDDIFAIWTRGLDKLKIFLTYINNLHPTIKFDYTYSAKSVNFLDTAVYINSTGKLESDLYIKPTDRTLLLHPKLFSPTVMQECNHLQPSITIQTHNH